ncbi:DUF3025 domain-containing protein [Nitrosomonas marina]|uniref:DUF3025 domain-containing protein n=1 Tax=Nitrosomonas marina TaxID=917 RepID=A0A1H8BSJ2_9PROT|nr:DUF3025 domain-containing protein [Nitrosomonas marina]SEM85732.1 Protein of unknown function [Nitrosomonas marina]
MTTWNPNFYNASPIFESLTPLAKNFQACCDWPSHQQLGFLLRETGICVKAGSGLPIQFVPQQPVNTKDRKQHYESRIFLTGKVSTRQENWHDFFNALVWITFPSAKAALNRIHYQELIHAQQTRVETRGPLRDAATLFDESGVVVLCSRPVLIELLKQHEWKKVFWQRRAAVLSSLRFIVFGHALYEKALKPYVGMTGKGLFIQVEDMFLRQSLSAQLRAVDSWLADFLLCRSFSSADLSPIPILGYPGWSRENMTEDYYENRQYFRPLKQRGRPVNSLHVDRE